MSKEHEFRSRHSEDSERSQVPDGTWRSVEDSRIQLVRDSGQARMTGSAKLVGWGNTGGLSSFYLKAIDRQRKGGYISPDAIASVVTDARVPDDRDTTTYKKVVEEVKRAYSKSGGTFPNNQINIDLAQKIASIMA